MVFEGGFDVVKCTELVKEIERAGRKNNYKIKKLRHTRGNQRKRKNKQQKELLTLIDEEDVNTVYKRRHPDPPSTLTEPPVYKNSGATGGLRPKT